LTEMAKVNELTIRQIFREGGDDDFNFGPFDDSTGMFSKLVYNWNIPLCAKMMFRFRETRRCPARLYRQIDPGNRQRFLRHFGIPSYIPNTQSMMEFFAWIKDNLGGYDIVRLEGLYEIENCENSPMYKNWSRLMNEIQFYYSLTSEQKDILISRFNKEVVEPYNRMDSDDIKQEFDLNDDDTTSVSAVVGSANDIGDGEYDMINVENIFNNYGDSSDDE
jgi:hypothetical protein